MLETLLSNRTVSVLWEALPRILSAGLTMTIPLTLVSFTLAMVLAVAVALVQYAKVPVLSSWPGSTSGSSAARRCWCSFSSSFTACPVRASC